MNLNEVKLIGRITRDPELKALPSGMKVAKFSIATNNVFKNKDGEKKETTAFHNCVAFGKVGEVIAQYVKKGQELYVCGRLEYQSWEKDGVKRNATQIIVSDFQFGQKAKGSESAEVDKKSDDVEYPEDEVNPEDIPF